MEASEQGTTEAAAPDQTHAPAVEQSPVASARDQAIVGDSGLFEQQPVPAKGDPDTPIRTSAPPAELQSGVPLAEDRAAGVVPGGTPPAVASAPEGEDAE